MVNRKDFRPSSSSSSISDKDRKTIKKYKGYSYDQQGDYIVVAKNDSMEMNHLSKEDAENMIKSRENKYYYGKMRIVHEKRNIPQSYRINGNVLKVANGHDTKAQALKEVREVKKYEKAHGNRFYRYAIKKINGRYYVYDMR